MQVYDLDKTQEWLNRTQRIGAAPPMRGGLQRNDRSLKQHVALFLASLFIVLLIIFLSKTSPSSAFVPAKLSSNGDRVPAEAKVVAPAKQEATIRPLARTNAVGSTLFEAHKSQSIPQDRIQRGPAGSFSVPPPAPVWLDR